ncbi:gamma subclass chorismate mutase AroQ [Promicromonospora sp. NPDC057488]|uniref:gamma subclass chorismate mutase AroQ n=1 Tax=Promicromonospora sp. NPDC057488 TaxID=3346147 RepID=UPI00366DB481
MVGISAQRVLLADQVAVAKFGTDSSIEETGRERRVLDDAVARAAEAGVSRQGVLEFFRAQIEASEFIQRGLRDPWAWSPGLAPTRHPDLAIEVRPGLDRMTVALIDHLAATEGLRRLTRLCEHSLARAEMETRVAFGLDQLHAGVPQGATSTVCGRSGPNCARQ